MVVTTLLLHSPKNYILPKDFTPLPSTFFPSPRSLIMIFPTLFPFCSLIPITPVFISSCFSSFSFLLYISPTYFLFTSIVPFLTPSSCFYYSFPYHHFHSYSFVLCPPSQCPCPLVGGREHSAELLPLMLSDLREAAWGVLIKV